MSPNPAILTWPRPVAAGGGPSVEYLGYAHVSGAATSYTFEDVPIGDAATDRTIIAVTYAREKIVSTVAISGVSATVDVAHQVVGISHATVSTGTTADIVVTYPTAPASAAVFVYRVSGAITVNDTATASGGSSGTAGGSLTIDTTADGYLLAGNYGHYDSTHAGTCTWQGTAGVAEDYDLYAGSCFSGASVQSPSAGTVGIDTVWSVVYYARLAAVAFTLT